MKPNYYINHHIQATVLGELLQKGPQTFSNIKPDDVENSLLMYHVHKLESRGLVEKLDGKFALTPEGTRWLNKTGLSSRPMDEPRCLVQFLVVVEDHVLVSKRLDHLAEHMNRYMLPGGLHKFGLSSEESADLSASNLGLTSVGDCITQLETIVKSENHHSITDIYTATIPDNYIFADDFYSVALMPIESVTEMSPKEAGSLPILLTNYLSNTISSRIVVRI